MLEDVSGTGMLWPLLIIFFTQVPFKKNIFEKNAKIENRLCPLPYEEVQEDIIKTVWTEQCGNF